MIATPGGKGASLAKDFVRTRLQATSRRHRRVLEHLGVLPLLRSAAALCNPRWRRRLGTFIDPPGVPGTAAFRLDGMRILVRPGEIVGHAVAYGQFEPFERSLFASLVREEDTVFDVGANFGLYSVVASTRLRGGALHAFEPHPDLFPILKANLEKRPFGRLEAHQFAIGATRGDVPFKCAIDSAFSSIVETGRVATERTVMVPMTTIEAFIQERKISLVDLMKIDVEGYEPEVLEGARRLLARPDAPILLLEVSQANLKPRKMTQGAVLGTLVRHGYEVFVADNRLRPLTALERDTGQVAAENFLAVKPVRRDRIRVPSGAA